MSWSFITEEEGQNKFSRWQSSYISNLNDFSFFFFFFLIYKLPLYYQPSFKPIGLLILLSKIEFQDGSHDGHLGFPIGVILAIFDPILPTKFCVNYPFGSGEAAQNRFLRWIPWWPSWLSDWKNFSFFYLQVIPVLLIKFRVSWPRDVGGGGF